MEDKNIANQKQVNKIAKNLGMVLVNAGTKMVRSAFDLKPKIYLSSVIQDTLKKILKIPADAQGHVSCADGKYRIVSWDTWEAIKDLDLLDQIPWLENYHDCDNFAFQFSSRAAGLYFLNSCGTAFGRLYDDSGKWIGNHAFNIIAIDNGSGLEFKIYEPMNDNWAKLTGPRVRLAHGWTYEPNWTIFF
jgi:hypothetical protein